MRDVPDWKVREQHRVGCMHREGVQWRAGWLKWCDQRDRSRCALFAVQRWSLGQRCDGGVRRVPQRQVPVFDQPKQL